MVGPGAKFGRKKEQAIAALLTKGNVEQGAQAGGNRRDHPPAMWRPLGLANAGQAQHSRVLVLKKCPRRTENNRAHQGLIRAVIRP